MTFLAECSGLSVGIDVIGCASAATNYVFGIGIVIIFFFILLSNQESENTKDRVATAMIATAVLAGFLSLSKLLPPQTFPYTIILAIGAAIAQYFTRE